MNQKLSTWKIFQGNAGRYAELTEGDFNYYGAIDLSDYYIISTKFADFNGTANNHLKGEGDVQVMDYIFFFKFSSSLIVAIPEGPN